MAAIERLASAHNLPIVEDCCQAHLATAGGRPVGTIGVAGAFSFYPTKNLGALRRRRRGRHERSGAGGAHQAAAQRRPDGPLRSPGGRRQLAPRRTAGRGPRRAAPVVAPLDRHDAASSPRATAPRWPAAASALPAECDGGHVYHLFVVRTAERATLRAHLEAEGIDTLVHYPIPIPKQPAMARVRSRGMPGGGMRLPGNRVAAAASAHARRRRERRGGRRRERTHLMRALITTRPAAIGSESLQGNRQAFSKWPGLALLTGVRILT